MNERCLHMEINEAIAIDDWLALTRIAKDIFGVCVSSRDLGEECRKNLRRTRPALESPVLWLKSRLVEINAFPALGKASDLKFVTYLHVFFPTLIEDEYMLAMLAWDEQQIEEAEARSKIFSTQKVPRPIDRVAQRVSGIRNKSTMNES